VLERRRYLKRLIQSRRTDHGGHVVVPATLPSQQRSWAAGLEALDKRASDFYEAWKGLAIRLVAVPREGSETDVETVFVDLQLAATQGETNVRLVVSKPFVWMATCRALN
jgi:hypothetical protein